MLKENSLKLRVVSPRENVPFKRVQMTILFLGSIRGAFGFDSEFLFR